MALFEILLSILVILLRRVSVLAWKTEEKRPCIFKVAATSTSQIQCVLEFIFKLMIMKVTKPKL